MHESKIYIGYDEREHIACEICKYSIRKQNSLLNYEELITKGIDAYKRPRVEEQSTDFTYSRFLVPYLSKYKGFSMFVDCDFLFLDDPQQLFEMAMADPSKAVWVCKHPEYIPKTKVKMDGASQFAYPRKNWSSLMVFNNAHPACRKLSPSIINDISKGRYLHRFQWAYDSEVGSIPLDWNCLDGYYHLENPKAIHYTDGGPWFLGYRETPNSELWFQYFEEWRNGGHKTISHCFK